MWRALAARQKRSKTRGRSSSAMPGPWSRTETSPLRTLTSTVAPAGLHFAALSTRFVTARRIRERTPRTLDSVASTTTRTLGYRKRTASAASAAISSRRTSSIGSGASSSRARSMRSATSVESRSICATRSWSSCVRSSSSVGCPRSRSSRFVRRLVSGVRSSCDASATSWRCERSDISSAASIPSKLRASRPSSSFARAPTRRVRSRVRVTSSTVSPRRATGASTARATSAPSAAATRTPASAISMRRTRVSASAPSTSSSGRERDAAAERRHVDAHADVPRLGGRVERLPLPRRDLAHLGRDERGDRLAEVGADDTARGVDELAEDVLSPGYELRRSSERRAPVVRARTAQDRPGGLGEGAVHLARELVLHDDVDRDRSADRGDRDGHRDERRHAKPEAHASLST